MVQLKPVMEKIKKIPQRGTPVRGPSLMETIEVEGARGKLDLAKSGFDLDPATRVKFWGQVAKPGVQYGDSLYC